MVGAWPDKPCKVVQMDVPCRAEGSMIVFAIAKGGRYRIQTP